MSTIHLPEFHEWWRGTPSPAAAHLEHWRYPVEGCPGCAVGPMLTAIHKAVYVEGRFLSETWALQDGYGEPGCMPPQGWDWSGIRDSSPAAIKRMYDVVTEDQP
jgi:hypothetical protein